MRLYFNNVPLLIHSRKAEELLALLACENGILLSKKGVAGKLWPDTEPVRAIDNLYKVLSYLKTYSDIDFPLVLRRGKIGLDINHYYSDIQEFKKFCDEEKKTEGYARAIEVYKGHLLSEENYEWVNEYEVNFEIRCIEMLEYLIQQDSQAKKYKLVAAYYKKLAMFYGEDIKER